MRFLMFRFLSRVWSVLWWSFAAWCFGWGIAGILWLAGVFGG